MESKKVQTSPSKILFNTSLLARLREATGDCVTTFAYLPRIAVEFTVRHIPGVFDPLGTPHPAYVLCEVSTARHDPHLRSLLEDALGAAMNRGDVLEATFAESIAQRKALWRLRESVPEAQRHEGASIKHDVAVPVAALPAFLHKASAAVAQAELEPVAAAHLMSQVDVSGPAARPTLERSKS